MHLMSIAILLFLLALDANADYFADRAFGTLALLYNRYGIVYVVTFVLLLAFNVHARYVLAKFRKRLAAISEPLVDELKQVVDEKIGT